MMKVAAFIKTTLIGGLFFIVPLVLVIVALSKVFGLLQRLVRPITIWIAGRTEAGAVMQQVAAILIIVIICFLGGLLASRKRAKVVIAWVEDTILQYIPGYQFFKKFGMSHFGLDDDDTKIVLVRVDDGWQISFLIEKINDDLYTVYVPGAPSPWTGSIYHVEKDKIRWTEMTKKQALDCIRQLGFGSGVVFREKLEKAIKLN